MQWRQRLRCGSTGTAGVAGARHMAPSAAATAGFPRALSPEASPGRWAVINAACLATSALVAAITVVGHVRGTAMGEEPWVYEAYNAYNLVTSALWIAEIGLIVWYSGLGQSRTLLLRATELALAVYFAAETMFSAGRWWFRSVPPDSAVWIVINAALNGLCYGYELFANLRARRRTLGAHRGDGFASLVPDTEC